MTLTDGTDFSIVIEKMTWAHSQWLVDMFLLADNDVTAANNSYLLDVFFSIINILFLLLFFKLNSQKKVEPIRTTIQRLTRIELSIIRVFVFIITNDVEDGSQ